MRIMFAIASLRRGGAERVAATLCNAWAKAGHNVSLVTFDNAAVAPAYVLHPSIGVENLDLAAMSCGLLDAIWTNVRRIRALKHAFVTARPDVVVSFMLEMNLLTIMASRGAQWRVVISERIHPAHHAVGCAWDVMRRVLYRRADAVVAQTSEIAMWLENATGACTHLMPNPIDTGAFRREPSQQRNFRKRLLAVGRLNSQKGHDLVIAAFAQVASDIPEWDLEIAGEGLQCSALQRQIDLLGMNGRIRLIGALPDIAALYADADAVVHGARYEGYPNVVVEALAAGKPVIATDAPGATRELLGHGRYGVLVPNDDSSELAAALRGTLSNPDKLASLAREAPKAVAANDVSQIAPRWLDLFSSLVGARP